MPYEKNWKDYIRNDEWYGIVEDMEGKIDDLQEELSTQLENVARLRKMQRKLRRQLLMWKVLPRKTSINPF